MTSWITSLFAILCLCAVPVAATADTSGNRTITFENMCPMTVRIGVNGAALMNSSGDRTSCSATNACAVGSTCLIPDGQSTGTCYFDFPASSTGSDVLAAGTATSPTSASYLLSNPVWNNGVNTSGGVVNVPVKWSGNVYAATHCDADGQNCQTGSCPKSVNGVASITACQSGVGPQGPATLAEFTLASTGVDYYDISMVNGANIPVSMAPTDTTGYPTEPKDAYWCGAPGNTADAGGLLGCSWNFPTTITPPGKSGKPVDHGVTLRQVAAGGVACTSDNDCTAAGEVCGTSYTIGTLDTAQTCGVQIGWWNANELCTVTNGGFGAPLNCSDAVTGQGTVTDLFQCVGANAASCYGAGGAACCGCPDWTFTGTGSGDTPAKLPLGPGFSCNGTNAEWTKTAEPWVALTKSACPTAYSFPYDDGTSTFTCASLATPTTSAPNAVDYTVTFCPGGNTGIVVAD